MPTWFRHGRSALLAPVGQDGASQWNSFHFELQGWLEIWCREKPSSPPGPWLSVGDAESCQHPGMPARGDPASWHKGSPSSWLKPPLVAPKLRVLGLAWP